MLLHLLLACSGGTADTADTGTGGTAPVVTWAEAFDTSGAGSLSGVWGSGPDDVYIVGGDENGARAFHYDGATWSEIEGLPEGAALLVWAFGFGPDDVWFVGEEGTALHWDGASWTSVETGTTEDLWGVWGSAPDDLWVVGGNWGEGEPLILHWDGTAFDLQTLPADENPRAATALFKVWGIGDTVFAVGERGLIVQLQDGAWKHVDGGKNADDDFVSLWGTSEDHIVAVGGRNTPRIATWDGTAWTTDKPSPSEVKPLNAVFLNAPDEAVIGGIYGFTATYDPTTGAIDPDPVMTTIGIHAIWGDGAGRNYAVGGTFAEPHQGVALVRTVQ